MTHSFALGHLLGRPDFGRFADHGITSLRGAFRDAEHGGWFASVAGGKPVDDSKQAYAHAFVVLAAASATAAGRPGAQELLDEALTVLDAKFFDQDAAMSVDTFDRTLAELEDYRGSTPTCIRWRRCWRQPMSPVTGTGWIVRWASPRARSMSSRVPTTGRCPSTTTATGIRCWTTTATSPSTRSGPTARPWATGSSGHVWCCTRVPR